jgi:hypothetical protein
MLLASQTEKEKRMKPSKELIEKLSEQNTKFVQEARIISTEIQRVAILQQEEW